MFGWGRRLATGLSVFWPFVAAAQEIEGGKPAWLESTIGCDHQEDLAIGDFEILSQVPYPGDLVDIDLRARLTNLTAEPFAAARASADWGSLELGIEVIPSLVTADRWQWSSLIPALGTSGYPSSYGGGLRLPAANVAALVAKLEAGEVPFTITAAEPLVLAENVHVFRWEDSGANVDLSGAPYWAASGSAPFGLVNGVPPGQLVFVVLDDRTGASLPPSLQGPPSLSPPYHYVRVTSVTPPAAGQVAWNVSFDRYFGNPQAFELTDLVVEGAFCDSGPTIDDAIQVTQLATTDGQATSEPWKNHQPLRFNGIELGGGAVTLSGQVAVPEIRKNIAVRVTDGKVAIDSGVEVQASLSVQLEAHASASFDEAATLLDLCFPVPALALGPVAVPMAVHVAAEVGAEAGVEAGVVLGFQKQFTGRTQQGHDPDRPAGQEYESSAAVDPSPIEFTPPRLTSDSGLQATVWTGLEAALKVGYSCPVSILAAGPTLGARVYGTLDVSPTDDPWWTLGHGADITAGFDVDFLGIQVLGFSKDFPLPGAETRSGYRDAEPSSASTSSEGTPVASGEDDRWAVSVEDLDFEAEIERAGIAALPDGGSVAMTQAINGNRNLIAAFDRFGARSWARRTKAGYMPEAVFAIDSGSVGVAGRLLTGDAFLAIVDATNGGALQGTRYAVQVPSVSSTATCVVKDAITFLDPGGVRGYLLVGYYSRAPVTQRDACAVRLDASGNVVWARVYDGGGREEFSAAAALPDGGFAAVGFTNWNPDAVQTVNGLLAKLDASGDLVWKRAVVAPDAYRGETLHDVALGADGTWYFTGATGRVVGQDGALLVGRVSGDGTELAAALVYQDEAWESLGHYGQDLVDTQGGNTSYDQGLSIAPAPGGFVVGGYTSVESNEPTPPSAAWALKINQGLGVEWFYTWDGAEDDRIHGVVPTADGFATAGMSRSMLPPGAGGDELALWVMHLPFEGAVTHSAWTNVLGRYIEPAIRSSFDAGEIEDAGVAELLDPPLDAIADAIEVTVTSVPDVIVATSPSLCVRLLTESGHMTPGQAEGCEQPEPDADADGVPDAEDNCPDVANPDQADADGDGVGDACELCDTDPAKTEPGSCGCGAPDVDSDGDGHLDCLDNCPLTANPGQEDTDADGAGDACDPDVDPPVISVTAPNGGEVLFGGVPFTVTWTASDDYGIIEVDLDYSLDDGSSWTPVLGCQGLAGSAGSCAWSTAGLKSSGMGARMRVRARDAAGNEGLDASDGAFRLKSGTPFVTVKAPNTSVSWQAGTSRRVKFSHNLGKDQPVAIEVNRSYPSGSWEPVTGPGCSSTTQASRSICNWVVGGVTDGPSARIRVRWLGYAGSSDVGDASFAITRRVKVTQPNTALTWATGATKTITWTHNLGLGSSFDLTLDSDGDLDCDDAVIATGVPASKASAGSYSWAVAGTGAANRVCIVRNPPDPDSRDESDVAFTITP